MCRRNPSSASVAFRMSWVTHGPSGSALVPAEDPEQAVERILTLVRERIPRRFGLDPVRDIQVLCPMNRGGAGARSLNVELQAALNPAGEEKVERFQGSEYPAVVIPVLTQHYAMLQRNLLYTGITRGKRLVVLVGQKKAAAIAVKNISGRRRWSKLDEWLVSKATLR